MNESIGAMPIEATMSAILATAFAVLVGLHSLQIRTTTTTTTTTPRPHRQKSTTAALLLDALRAMMPLRLPDPHSEPSRYCYEVFAWRYTIVWIGIFGYIVIFQCYEQFTAWGYFGVCGGLALPLMLQPALYPRACAPPVVGTAKKNDGEEEEEEAIMVVSNPDARRPFHMRYSTKATLYLITYSFIGNYWYTHYFYSVLKAEYTMPAHRWNDVPIAMYLATHFYFCTYHACVSNGFLRFVDRSYEDDAAGGGGGGWWRKKLLFCYTILFLSYFTAFMETLTISSFPYYSFEDRTMAYVWGSAFYGVYFIVSFPGFYYLDSHVDEGISISSKEEKKKTTTTQQQQQSYDRPVTLMDTFTIACGHGMMILTMLDFVRLYLGIPLVIGGIAFAST